MRLSLSCTFRLTHSQCNKKESRFVFDGLRSFFYDSLKSGIAEVKEILRFVPAMCSYVAT